LRRNPGDPTQRDFTFALADDAKRWHDQFMPLPPWVIDELSDERARREEEERSRSRRIELPQTPADGGDVGRDRGAGAVERRAPVVLDISPRNDGAFDL
jgi:hypothetical protein